jgi:hypothetical protein
MSEEIKFNGIKISKDEFVGWDTGVVQRDPAEVVRFAVETQIGLDCPIEASCDNGLQVNKVETDTCIPVSSFDHCIEFAPAQRQLQYEGLVLSSQHAQMVGAQYDAPRDPCYDTHKAIDAWFDFKRMLDSLHPEARHMMIGMIRSLYN